MNRQKQIQELERQVQVWLDGQSDGVRYVRSTGRHLKDSLEVDFLVLQPFPFAIEMMVSSSRGAIQVRAKRFLNQRISLAERFSRFLPVIVVTLESDFLDRFSFADAVFSVMDLPSIEALRENLNLDDAVQRVLKEGDPGEVHFSTSEDVVGRGCGISSFSELVSPHVTFPEKTLAQRLQRTLVPLKAEIEEGDESTSLKKMTPSKNGSMQSPSRSGRNSLLSFIRSRRVWPEFERVLYSFILERCGGEIKAKRFKKGGYQGQISRNVWHASNGRRVVLRRFMTSPGNISLRVQELIAEAWMTRAFTEGGIDAQVLLMGSTGGDVREVKTLKGITMAREPSGPFEIQHINLLEGAGWTVCPWDFENEKPDFIKVLEEIGHD